VARIGVLLFLILGLTAVEVVVAADNSAKEASADMEFGYKAARRGYWQEALMRFEHANELTPGQPRILNNLAVAQEANGLYEEALLSYQTGLAIDPRNDALKRNYTRFQEFYASFIAPPEPEDGEEGGEGDKGAADAEEND
jgi:tetratricopeptide (TPR) repeat protein